ncbi:alpha/beta fold hydrolase [Phenylobacterium sp.]|jgi:pimeloyl-ACP methyl ester carboxylesterase|uniref:alpha/beta fold hydrolase n=1 Tax=Phenylobacterium sp. TaxID=1871053 RepID=UPI0037C7C9E4
MTDPFIGPTSHSFVSQRLRLHYVDWGNPTAPPLILVHGGRDHCRNWDWVAQELRRDYHIIAPDLRGHGDSAYSPSGDYSMSAFVYDLAQLIHQKGFPTVRIVAHSLGGSIALRYAGAFPETVTRLVAIEGMGPSPAMLAARAKRTPVERLRNWVSETRTLAGRLPRRYASIEEAYARMQAENRHLTPEQARYLTIHGASQNEDGTYSWKFDNYVRSFSPADFSPEDQQALWANINCPVLLVNGKESWASNPQADGRAAHFKDVRVVEFERAGHWVHHDRLEGFLAEVRAFL